ncbi:MAG TPA: cache domain-containing protein, partial [Spirochaetia bacterium]|nr:cache domain-containing protein [Spirochaetia bacterium]
MALRLPPVRRLRPLGPFRRLAHRYQYDIPLRRKLLLANVLIIALPLAALALFSTESVSRITERRASFSAEQSLEQAASYLNYTMYNIVKASDLIFLSSEVNSALSADHTDYPISNQLRDMNNLRNYLFSFQDGVNVDRVRLYVPPGLIYSDEDINLFNFATAQKSKWFQALERSGDSMLWCPSSLLTGDPGGGSSDRLSLARFLVDQNDLRRRIGALRLDFRKEAVRAILRKADTIVGSESYIVGRDDALVASSDPAANNRIRLASRQEAALPTDGLFRRMVVSGRTVLVGARPLRESSWIVVTVVPYAAITAESRNVRDGIFLVMLAALLIA